MREECRRPGPDIKKKLATKSIIMVLIRKVLIAYVLLAVLVIKNVH